MTFSSVFIHVETPCGPFFPLPSLLRVLVNSPRIPSLPSLLDLSASGINPNHHGNSQVVTHWGTFEVLSPSLAPGSIRSHYSGILLDSAYTMPLFLCRTQVPFAAVLTSGPLSSFSCALSLCLCFHSVSSKHSRGPLHGRHLAWLLTVLPEKSSHRRHYCCIGL